MVGERWSEGQEREGAGEGLAGRAGESGEGQGMSCAERDGRGPGGVSGREASRNCPPNVDKVLKNQPPCPRRKKTAHEEAGVGGGGQRRGVRRAGGPFKMLGTTLSVQGMVRR